MVSSEGRVLNTCSSQVLVEMLQFLKRAYWPFSWQSAPGMGPYGGGFNSAAKVSLYIDCLIRSERLSSTLHNHVITCCNDHVL